jgi:hypothetical protein
MATKAAFRRLTKEYMELQKKVDALDGLRNAAYSFHIFDTSPPPFILARPTESNILEW